MITISPRFKIYSIALLALAGVLHAGKKPEEQKGYDKSKDAGLKAPKGAEVLFDGTMESVRKNWEMWPKKDMEITWKIMDNPNGKGKTLMTDGGKRWGTHDLVTKKKYTRTTKTGKTQERHALRGKTSDGRNLTKFVSKADWDALDAPIEKD